MPLCSDLLFVGGEMGADALRFSLVEFDDIPETIWQLKGFRRKPRVTVCKFDVSKEVIGLQCHQRVGPASRSRTLTRGHVNLRLRLGVASYIKGELLHLSASTILN